MARSAGRQQRKKEDLHERFNRLLDDVFSAGPRFQMRKIEEFERTGLEARQDQVMSSRPKKVRDLPVPSLRQSPGFTKEAVASALRLAESLEMARKPEELDLRGWVHEGVVI